MQLIALATLTAAVSSLPIKRTFPRSLDARDEASSWNKLVAAGEKEVLAAEERVLSDWVKMKDEEAARPPPKKVEKVDWRDYFFGDKKPKND